MTTVGQLQRFVAALRAEEQYDSDEGHWTFQSGGSCCCCTDAATKVAKVFGGRVVGYSAANNRSALVGTAHCGGHDFALVEDRFIVDYWAFRVAGLIPKPVLDLNRREDRELSRRHYGDPDSWEDVPVASQ
jgi:hypothetical protein